MFQNIDLKALAERSGPERAFLTLYLSGPEARGMLDGRISKVRNLLDEESDEAEHLEENLRMLEEFFESYDFESGSLAIFSCWALEFFQAYPLKVDLPDLLWIDSSPYIRPLAQLQDDYEDFVVVLADNTRTRVFLVTSAVPREEQTVKGNIKNHVRKGGWSQQRYERRRDNALGQYAKEVVDVLKELDDRRQFDKLLFLGSDETMREIREELPQHLVDKLAGTESVDLHQDDETWESAFEMFFEEDRQVDRELWQLIKDERLQEGRAALGPDEVLEAAVAGRVERMLISNEARLAGKRCRDCENLLGEGHETCPMCGSESLFKVDLIEELIELLYLTGTEPEFTDPIPGLTRADGVGALLRY